MLYFIVVPNSLDPKLIYIFPKEVHFVLVLTDYFPQDEWSIFLSKQKTIPTSYLLTFIMLSLIQMVPLVLKL